MNSRELEIRKRHRDDFVFYAQKNLKIITKSGGKHEPFILNQAQRHSHALLEKQLSELGRVRAIFLKGRQQGISTYVGGRFYHKVTHKNGVKAFVMAHEKEATQTLFEMTQRYHHNCHPLLQPSAQLQSKTELYFAGLDSGYKVGTAGNKGVGRGSTIQFLHGSEVALWPNADEHAKGILQAVSDMPGTEIILESTARGMGNYFHEQWQLAERGESEYIPIFLPWFWQREYSKDLKEPLDLTDEEIELMDLYDLNIGQISWRRFKIKDLSAEGADGYKSFKQEYPCIPAEAFQTTGSDTYFKPEIVMRARKADAEQHGAKLVGVDPARFGEDATGIIRRCGRVAYYPELHRKKDTMQVAGIVVKIIKEEQPDRVFVDVGGLGAGVVDRLWEMGYDDVVESVNSGESAFDDNKYYNKRAEMWGECRKWIADQPAKIPDDDVLHAELCSPQYDFDSKNRLRIEKKELMKKRGVKSPNLADALCLTFASPVRKNKDSQKTERYKGSFETW
jgi:hypothetical protein